MWLFFAFGSAFFAGLTSILAKCGIKSTDSSVATTIRTIVVLFFSWVMVFVTGAQDGLSSVSPKSLVFLLLSGLATGASWLCYFRALQLGNINKVVPIDKSGTVLTVLLAFILLGEPIGLPWMAAGLVLVAAGTYLMLEKKSDAEKSEGRGWLLYAVGSAVFASLTAILGKVGIDGVDSTLGTAIRTCVVPLMAWAVVLLKGKRRAARGIPKKEMLFILASGIATGASWLCYYRALHDGPASVVVPVDKLSILVSIAFSFFVFGERLTKKALLGLALIVAGTLLMLF